MNPADFRLLIVDDNEDNRRILVKRLQRDGYHRLDEADDGRVALALLGEGDYDLVLLDVMMPELSGYEVLDAMRADRCLRDIPVIVISANDEMDSVVRCIEAGAADYLSRPFNSVLLRARIRASLEKKRLRDETLRQLKVIRQVFGQYVPRGIAEAIVEGLGTLQPTKRVATILYTDIEAFTTRAESMPPEQVVGMLNEYFPAVIEPITERGGIVNQFQGDAMLVTFNLPVEDEDHADKAVEVALAIQRTLEGRTFAGVPLKTRIGVNTGEVIAGNVGSGERMNYTVHGDAVNLAARLEQLNKEYGSQVLVSENTVNLLKRQHPLQAMGEVAIRGKSQRVGLYRLDALDR